MAASPSETERAHALLALAHNEYSPDLLPAELAVMVLSVLPADTLGPSPAGSRPIVRAEFLRWLATTPAAVALFDPKGIRMENSSVSGTFNLEKCQLQVPLVFKSCTFTKGVDIQFSKMTYFEISNAEIVSDAGEPAIAADGARFSGPFLLRNTICRGSVLMRGVQIGSDCDFSGSTVSSTCKVLEEMCASRQTNSSKTPTYCKALLARCGTSAGQSDAVSLDGTIVGGSLTFSPGFSSFGTLRLPSAQIHGQVNLYGAVIGSLDALVGKQWDALALDYATVRGLTSIGMLRTAGLVRLVGAQIGGNLECSGAVLSAPGTSLAMIHANVGGDVSFESNFTCQGKALLRGAKISGDLIFLNVKVGVIDCEDVKLDGKLYWINIQPPGKASLILSGATVNAIHDEERSWPAPSNSKSEGVLELNGLIYRDLVLHTPAGDNTLGAELPFSVQSRIDWLNHQSPEGRKSEQPFIELSNLVATKGDADGAKQVILALGRNQAPQKGYRRYLTIGWEQLKEEPQDVAYVTLVMGVVGSIVFWRAHRMGAMVPTDDKARKEFKGTLHHGQEAPAPLMTPANSQSMESAKGVPDGKEPLSDSSETKGKKLGYPPFNPLIYVLENVLPVVKLGQDDKWAPDPQHVPRSGFPKVPALRWTGLLNSYSFLAWTRWILIIFGWAFAIILAGVITGLFKS